MLLPVVRKEEFLLPFSRICSVSFNPLNFSISIRAADPLLEVKRHVKAPFWRGENGTNVLLSLVRGAAGVHWTCPRPEILFSRSTVVSVLSACMVSSSNSVTVEVPKPLIRKGEVAHP